ncbi:Gldg family protein [Sphingobacterium paucimobilis]|nr:Gldg family protein [Sphingobacterium paucimobilis]
MKNAINIVKAEIKLLFYSPVAWLILLIFSLQCTLTFTESYSDHLRNFFNNGSVYKATHIIFTTRSALFSVMQQYLYLYIPLLTMGIFSREINSGSIKLLFSSPIKTIDIILGKYMALLLFSLVLLIIPILLVLFGGITIDNMDWGSIIAALLGIFLLMATYCAIGLFMSSLTSYTVVAAIGTMAIFAFLSYIQGVGQELDWVRDITYWLSISGRASTFVSGMITTEDVLYFLLLITAFLSFLYIRMNAQRKHVSLAKKTGQYVLVVAFVLTFGVLSALPSFKKYADLTATKSNTLLKGSQKVVSSLQEKVQITTYVNMLNDDYVWFLPNQQKYDMDKFASYVRFKPDIKMKYVYYFAEPEKSELYERFQHLGPEKAKDSIVKLNDFKFPILSVNDIAKDIDLKGEKYRTVRLLETESGKKTFLRFFDDMQRFPSEAEISAALKRLSIEQLPTVAFVNGHNERDVSAINDRGYNRFTEAKTFRYSLINQGFNFKSISLDQPISEDVKILIIAEPRQELSPQHLLHINDYINKGGNMIIATDPGVQQYTNPILASLGLEIQEGLLVQPDSLFSPDLLLMKLSPGAGDINYYFSAIEKRELQLPLSGASPIIMKSKTDFNIIPLFKTDSLNSWVELQTTNFIDDSVTFDPLSESKGAYATALALRRNISGDKEQKILVTSDADWLSNFELNSSREGIKSASFNLLTGAFHWFTDSELPIDMRSIPYKDKTFSISKEVWQIAKIFLIWGTALLLLLSGSILLLRRRGR